MMMMLLLLMIVLSLCCCSYLRQVANETLRWAVISPYTGRVQDIDTVIDGHVIPAGVSYFYVHCITDWLQLWE